MTIREFLRFHLMKVLLVLVALQIIVIIIIQNFNHRPKAVRDGANVIEERTVKITPVSNDTDKDDHEELSILDVLSPLNGKVEQIKNLLFYTPNTGFTGVDSFAYTVTDGRKESREGYIVIHVNKNLEPIGNKDSVEVYIGGVISIDVLGNDEDRENDSIFIKDFTNPNNGEIKLSKGRFIYSASNTAQPDSFQYVLSDGKSNTGKIPVLINIKGKNDPCYPWLSMDIGNYSIPGSFRCINKTLVIEASGRDIWNEFDGFRYVFQFISGDCEIITKVDSLIGNHEWAKASIMVRESLSGGSKTAMVLVSNRNGATVHNRFTTNERMEGTDKHEEAKAPYWLKLVREGDLFHHYISENGKEWKKIESIQNPMPEKVYIGFGVTSHDNNETAKAVFSHFRLTAKAGKQQ